MELNALTRLESLANDLSKLSVRHRVQRQDDKIDDGHRQTLQFFNDEFPEFVGDERQSFADNTEESRRRLWQVLRVLVRRAIRRFGKGFMIGALIQALYVCSKVILSKSQRRALRKQQPLKALGLVKILQLGGFVGTFLTVFEIGMLITQLLFSHRTSCTDSSGVIIRNSSDAWATVDRSYDCILSASTAAVGGLAGLSLWLAPKSYRTQLAVFFGIRSLEIGTKLLCERGYLPFVPCSDILLMSLSSSQVLYAWLFNRESLDSSYLGFLDFQSGKSRPVCEAYRQAMTGDIPSKSSLQSLNEYRSREGLKLYVPGLMPACSILHPEHENCFVAAGAFVLNSLKRTLPVYVPIYFLPLFVFRTKKALEEPWSTTFHTVFGIFRSATFLSSYCAVAWLSSCLQRRLGFHSTLTGYIAGLCAGATVALEKKPRRIEISLYTLSRALTSIHYNVSRFLRSKNIIVNIPEFDVLCFAISTALLFHTFVWRPASLRPGYYVLLKWMIGSGVLNIPNDHRNDN